MKHLRLFALLMIAAAMMVVSCSKEENPIPDSKVIGTWRVPLTASADVFACAGQKLIINEDHTATLNGHLFSQWKFSGRDLILSNYKTEGGNREVDVLKLTINDINANSMTVDGTYTHSLNNYIDLTGDVSGVYTRTN